MGYIPRSGIAGLNTVDPWTAWVLGAWTFLLVKILSLTYNLPTISEVPLYPWFCIWGFNQQWILQYCSICYRKKPAYKWTLAVQTCTAQGSPILILCLTFWGTTKWISIRTASFYIPISSARGFQFLYVLTNIIKYIFENSFSGAVRQNLWKFKFTELSLSAFWHTAWILKLLSRHSYWVLPCSTQSTLLFWEPHVFDLSATFFFFF